MNRTKVNWFFIGANGSWALASLVTGHYVSMIVNGIVCGCLCYKEYSCNNKLTPVKPEISVEK